MSDEGTSDVLLRTVSADRPPLDAGQRRVTVIAGVVQSARNRASEALERLEKVDTLVIDKTGTLTEGKPRVTVIHRVAEITENDF